MSHRFCVYVSVRVSGGPDVGYGRSRGGRLCRGKRVRGECCDMACFGCVGVGLSVRCATAVQFGSGPGSDTGKYSRFHVQDFLNTLNAVLFLSY